MTARDVIARAIAKTTMLSTPITNDVIEALHAAGYRILAPAAEIEAMKKEAFMAGCKWQSEMGGKEKPDAR